MGDTEERPLDDLVRWRVEDGIGWLTLNRPEARNALTMAMRDRVSALLEAASGDLHVRCVVIAASGQAFCAGADLRAGRQDAPPRPEHAPERAAGDVTRLIASGWQRLIRAVLDCEKPVVAAVNGTAAGGGMHLAVAADLVLAAETARFVSVFVRRGIAPDAGGAYLLTRLVGPQRAKELLFFGDDLSAGDAASIGLVNRVVPAVDLDATVASWARRLASGPTVAIGATKQLVNRALDSDRDTALLEEALLQEIVVGSHDAGEGVAAFVERRDPEFEGW